MPEGDSRLGRLSFTRSEVGVMVTFLLFGLVVSIVGTVASLPNRPFSTTHQYKLVVHGVSLHQKVNQRE